MKTKLLLSVFALAAIALTSCSKTEDVKPLQTVTYTVKCDYCLIQVEDNTWNGSNELDRSKSQHFVVNGNWQYKWTNTNLDSVTMKISVGAFGNSQEIKASIVTNDGKKAFYGGKLGFDPVEDFENEAIVGLKLR